MKIAIVGPPRAGKTTLARTLSKSPRHTDDLIGICDWSEASEAVAGWFSEPSDEMVVEGVAVPRALRKWLASNPDGKPVDRIVRIREPVLRLTPGQARMAKACDTVFDEILPELRRRGVEIEEH